MWFIHYVTANYLHTNLRTLKFSYITYHSCNVLEINVLLAHDVSLVQLSVAHVKLCKIHKHGRFSQRYLYVIT